MSQSNIANAVVKDALDSVGGAKVVVDAVVSAIDGADFGREIGRNEGDEGNDEDAFQRRWMEPV